MESSLSGKLEALRGLAVGYNLWNYSLAPPFLRPFGALMLSLRNLGLEFGKLVLYYFVRQSGVIPHDAKPPNHLLVSSNESFG
jgi:hypothetical protein